MNVQRMANTRSAMSAVAIASGLVLVLSGCGGGDDDEPSADSSSRSEQDASGGGGGDDESGGGETLAEVKGGDNITLAIQSAKRDQGGFVTVSGSVKNGSGKLWLKPSWSGQESELRAKNAASMAGAKLVDKSGKKRYYILRDTEGRCLCTVFQGGVKPGESKTWYAQFPAPPEGSNKVDFQIADMPPASITISEG